MSTEVVIAELNETAELIRRRVEELGQQLETIVGERESLQTTLEAYEAVLSAHRMHCSHSGRQELLIENETRLSDGYLDPSEMTVKVALSKIASMQGGTIKVPAATRELFKAGFFLDYSGGRDVVHATLRRAVAQNEGWRKVGRGLYERMETPVAIKQAS